MQFVQEWVYLAEGNANVVFKYVGSDAYLSGKVLRLRKSGTYNRFTAEEQQDYLERVVLPNLGRLAENVLRGELFRLTETVLAECREALRGAHDRRPLKFLSASLDSGSRHGILLQYLVADSEFHRIVEFKPKWLSQSPGAPASARQCRTCALRCMRGAGLHDPLRFCPLDLVSAHANRVRKAVVALNCQYTWDLCDSELDAITKFIMTTTVFYQLRDLQKEFEHDLPFCMTLRDCSVFLVLNKTKNVVERAWLADLDRKSTNKVDYWQQVEIDLVDGGWYTRELSDTCILVDS